MKQYIFREISGSPDMVGCYDIHKSRLIDENEVRNRLVKISSHLMNIEDAIEILTAPPPKDTDETTQDRIDNAMRLLKDLKKAKICMQKNNPDS